MNIKFLLIAALVFASVIILGKPNSVSQDSLSTAYTRSNNLVSLDQFAGSTDSEKLQTAIDIIGSMGRTLLLAPRSSVYDFGNKEIPVNVNLMVPAGVIINDSLLIIKGNLYAGRYKIFAKWMNLDNAKIECVYPEWFGAKGDSSTDNYTALQNAVNSITKGTIKLLPGFYHTSNTIELKGSIKLQGNYSGYEPNTVLVNEAGSGKAAIIIMHSQDTARGTGIYDLDVWAGANSHDGSGILVYKTRFCELKNIGIRNFKLGYGLVVSGSIDNDTMAAIQNSFSKIFLYNNKINLYVTGKTGSGTDDNSADEGLFSDINIQTEGIPNGIGIWMQRGFGNTFVRTSINERFSNNTVTGVWFDDADKPVSYATRGNNFWGLAIEGTGKPIVFSPNTSANHLESVHIFHPGMGIPVIDSSGGANYIGSIAGGEVQQRPTSYYLPTNQENLLVNPDFERWEDISLPTGWNKSGDYSIQRSDDVKKTGERGVRLEVKEPGSYKLLLQKLSQINYLKGEYISFGAWVKTKAASLVELRLYDAVSTTQSIFHPGDNEWHYLTTRHKVSTNSGYAVCAIVVDSNKAGIVYLDGATVCRNFDVPLFTDSYLTDSKRLEKYYSWESGSVANDAIRTVVVPVWGASLGDPVSVGFNGLVQPGVILTGIVSDTNFVTITLYNKNGATVYLSAGLLKIYVYK